MSNVKGDFVKEDGEIVIDERMSERCLQVFTICIVCDAVFTTEQSRRVACRKPGRGGLTCEHLSSDDPCGQKR